MPSVVGLLPLVLLALLLVTTVYVSLIVRRLFAPPRRTLAHALAHRLPADPGAAGCVFSEWKLERPDGTVLHVWDLPGRADALGRLQWGSSNESLPCASLILLHAWGRSRLHALAEIDRWRAVAPRIVIPELRGHGEAFGGGPTYGAREAEDLLDIIERLEPPVVLVGTSLGGVVAIRAAALDAESGGGEGRLSGVVAASPYDRLDRVIRARLREQHYPAGLPVTLAMVVLRAMGVQAGLTTEEAARLAVPLLVLHGAEDPWVGDQETRAIAAAAPDGRHEEVAGRGHLELADVARLIAVPAEHAPEHPG